MDVCLPIYNKPGPTPVPAATKNTCPYCGAAGYRSPGPCKSCGVTGYPSEQPPGLQLGRVWRLRGRDYLPDAEADHDSLEDTPDLDLELSASSLDLIDLDPDDDSPLHNDEEVYN